MLDRLRLVLAALALAAAGASCGARAPSALERVRAAGVLRWGADLAGGEPYVFEDPARAGKIVGFEVDLVEAVARELGVRAELQQCEWSALVPALERGAFDVIWNGLEATPRNAARVALTRPYFVFAERLTVRRGDSRIAANTTDLAALAGRRVGTLASSLAADLLARVPGVTTVLYDGVDTPYDDLANGRTDAVLLDDVEADRYAAVHKELVAAADVAEGYYAVGARTGDEDLRDAIDAALDRVARRGELRSILERWRLWQPREEPLLDWTPARARALAAALAVPGSATPRLDLHRALLFFQAAGATLVVSTLAMALAIPLGLLLAMARLFGGRALAALAAGYVELFRGTPVLLQLYVLYFGIAEIVRLGPVEAAVLGLALNYAAYEAEVYRGAITAVPRGQLEAALALGMTLRQALRRVVLPQAARVALPAVTNDYIALLKDSSLVSVITVVELTKRAQIAAIEMRSWLWPGLSCAALYFAMSWPLSLAARRLEARLGGAGLGRPR
jgi:polar amino acid transport system substrate-binding protein